MPSGKIQSKKGELATVLMERQDMCGECHACEMLAGKKECILTCQCEVPCEVGDEVDISLSKDYFLKATYMMYGIPLLGLIIGLFLGYSLGELIGEKSELLGLLGSLIGIGVSLLCIKIKEAKQHFNKYLPKIIGKK